MFSAKALLSQHQRCISILFFSITRLLTKLSAGRKIGLRKVPLDVGQPLQHLRGFLKDDVKTVDKFTSTDSESMIWKLFRSFRGMWPMVGYRERRNKSHLLRLQNSKRFSFFKLRVRQMALCVLPAVRKCSFLSFVLLFYSTWQFPNIFFRHKLTFREQWIGLVLWWLAFRPDTTFTVDWTLQYEDSNNPGSVKAWCQNPYGFVALLHYFRI